MEKIKAPGDTPIGAEVFRESERRWPVTGTNRKQRSMFVGGTGVVTVREGRQTRTLTPLKVPFLHLKCGCRHGGGVERWPGLGWFLWVKYHSLSN